MARLAASWASETANDMVSGLRTGTVGDCFSIMVFSMIRCFGRFGPVIYFPSIGFSNGRNANARSLYE
jgi:hypothetical protein